MRSSVIQVLFWTAVAVPIYTYVGYFMVLTILSRLRRRVLRKADIEPSVSLLIPAYNEATVIANKIQNSLAIDYPAAKLEIVIACDGSTDGTPEVARAAAAGTRVKVLAFTENRGKIETLNRCVPNLGGEVVVFSDASAMIYPDAIRVLMRNFADPDVGAASGKYVVVKADDVSTGKSEDLYWKYETRLKVMESQLSSTLGGHGHLHAIRRDLYPFPPDGTINDDYVIPVSVLRRRRRAVYEPDAVVYEEARHMTGFGRRVRIVAGNLQQLSEIRGLFQPLQALPLFFFLSHKVARLAVPFAIIAAWVLNLFLLDHTLYRIVFMMQCVFYTAAVLGVVYKLKPRSLLLPFYFCMINLATLVAFYRLFIQRRQVAWK